MPRVVTHARKSDVLSRWWGEYIFKWMTQDLSHSSPQDLRLSGNISGTVAKASLPILVFRGTVHLQRFQFLTDIYLVRWQE